MTRFDLVVVGSGAGLNVLEAGVGEGWSCALVEQGKVGGTCLTRGCIPSKVLTTAADAVRQAQSSARIGIACAAPRVDWDLVSSRTWRQIDDGLRIEKSFDGVPNLTVFRGTGEFTGERRMRVRPANGPGEPAEFEADRFVLATGARSAVPPIPGLEDAGFVTTDSFFGDRYPARPWSSVVIVGGGIIAAEFAHVFSAFGSKVTILEMGPRLLASEEPEISAFVEREFRKTMDVLLGCRAAGARRGGTGRKVVTYRDADGESGEVEAEEIFVATGRRPNSDLLALDRSGVETDAGGWIRTDPFLETTRPGIWAIGDAMGGLQFRHKANYDAQLCVENMLAPPARRTPVDYSAVPWAVFTNPQVGHVGLTEAQALAAGRRAYIARNPYAAVAKGYSLGYDLDREPGGFAKVVADEDGRILGAHVVGPEAALLVQPFVYLMNTRYPCPVAAAERGAGRPGPVLRSLFTGGSLWPMMRSMVIHPSLNEVPAWALANLRPAGTWADEAHHHHHDGID